MGTTMTEVAGWVRTDMLDPALDALSLNQQQALRGFNPDGACNSALETNKVADRAVALALGDPTLAQSTRDALKLAARAIRETDGHVGAMFELNAYEGRIERTMASRAESKSAELYTTKTGLGTREVGDALRPALAVRLELARGRHVPTAEREAKLADALLTFVVRQAPDSVLTGRSLAHDLGQKATAALLAILATTPARKGRRS